MRLDGHIHIGPGPVNQKELLDRMGQAGLDGGVLISLRPTSFLHGAQGPSMLERLDNVMEWTEGQRYLYPYYWIDPLEEDAVAQVAAAVEHGVSGFKIICNRFYPYDERVLEVCRAIAGADKPLLFHSGILYNGEPSARYNRPGGFEAMLDVPGLRFALAHISWPWCDELIAVYGKFQSAKRRQPDMSVKLFVDITRGTPSIYRRDALTKLYKVGFDVRERIIFGTDGRANDFGVKFLHDRIVEDDGIYADLGLDAETLDLLYAGNLRSFVGDTEAE